MERFRLIKIADYISSHYKSVAEIGIGNFPDIALLLKKRGLEVIATDIKEYNYKGLRFFIDDIFKPDLNIYKGIQLLYSIRPPNEFLIYMKKLAKDICSDLLLKPLSSDVLDGYLVNYNGIYFYLWKWNKIEVNER